MGLLEECRKYFFSDNLYEVLSVEKSASENDIKKAYKKLSLRVHPDRVGQNEKEEATKKFQVLSKVHFILSDEEKRAVYDDTGEIDEEDGLSQDRDWTDYWRLIFPRVKEADIEKFMSEYKGSEEEKNDIKKYYLQFNGDMDQMCDCLMGYTYDDEERHREIINGLIKSKEVPSFPKFTKESAAKRKARQKRFEKEAAEAEKEEMKRKASESSLVNAIAKRANQRFDDMISHLESKYASKGKSSNKKSKNKSGKK